MFLISSIFNYSITSCIVCQSGNSLKFSLQMLDRLLIASSLLKELFISIIEVIPQSKAKILVKISVLISYFIYDLCLLSVKVS